MALTDKNIIITPNNGQAAEPVIVFSGADGTTTAQDISLNVYPTDSGTVSFEGSAGQLFSITNSLTDTIFSVNDVSGIPSIEVIDTGEVKIAELSGNVLLGQSTDTGEKLQVNGVIKATSVTASLSGNATTATKLLTARNIGGVSFNGSSAINLPGVNTAGNQNTTGSSGSCTGNAATASNAALLDNIDSDSFLRSDAADICTGDTQWQDGKSPWVYDAANGARYPAPGGATYYSNAGSLTGALKIKLPILTNNNSSMLSFDLHIYDYAGEQSITMHICGYAFASGVSWHNHSVQTITTDQNKDFTVRFGSDGTSNCLWVGELASTWDYLNVGVFNLMVGYSFIPTEFASGWAITLVTAFDTVQDTITNNLPIASSAKDLTYATNSVNEVGRYLDMNSSIDFYKDYDVRLEAAPGIGGLTGDGTLNITANGGLVCSGNITAYSDARIKENVELIPDALSKVKQLNGYTYNRNDQGDTTKRHTGVIAQEVLKVLPEAVQLGETPEDNMAVAYGNMMGLMIEAIKELEAKVDKLENK